MNLKTSFIVGCSLTLISLIVWETYWRTKPELYRAVLEDDRYLWAEQRAKVKNTTKEDIVIIGSSRTAFNINTHIWKTVQGIQPINLSTDGKPPGPFLEDIVYNTDFKGTIIAGVTPLLWFSPPNNQRWLDAKSWVNHYHEQTPAQKLGHQLSKPLQRHLVMLTNSELEFYNDLDLKSLINTIHLPNDRLGDQFMLYNFSYRDEDRNIMMLPIMIEDSLYAKRITNVWNSFLPSLPSYNNVKDIFPLQFSRFKQVVDDFKAKGGQIIFIRHKAEPPWYDHAQRMMPRAMVYDKFIETVDCPSYHFQDYPFMSKYRLPDWSHMYVEDAITYTEDLVNQLIKDQLIQKKTN
ncbi:hypothetical protein [Winogradskyella sp.]|uniref:hypothetical protein n=1 Tax=Winogradskyella sp. TaxID=1883156 RepID=UPI003BA89780